MSSLSRELKFSEIIMTKQIVTREIPITPENKAKELFSDEIDKDTELDIIFKDSTFNYIIAVSGIPKKVPIVMELIKNENFYSYIKKNISILIKFQDHGKISHLYQNVNGLVSEEPLNTELQEFLNSLYQKVQTWGGLLNEYGELIVDLDTPSPGPHYYANLIIGNRIDNEMPLQSTPKGVVDRLGRGSFRSHAAVQVLATRWDMLPEENGFPANRQFYILENGKQIFYSANPLDNNISKSYCIHSQNHTKIHYITKCGLEIERIIFILPQEDGMPIATETQQIIVNNLTENDRDLKIIITGMFGTESPHALSEDVIYSNVIMQSKILQNDDGSLKAVSWDYYPIFSKQEQRFHSTIIQQNDEVNYPSEFCFNYFDFIGSGTLERPQNILHLNNKMQRKGPGFFAVASNIILKKNSTVIVDNFTGLVSKTLNKNFDLIKNFEEEIGNLISLYSQKGKTAEKFKKVIEFQKEYTKYIQVESEDKNFQAYFNQNLPFQIQYQTFVSRSFAQTQKGYREIGFREIQDLYASMYYFVAMGKTDFVKTMIKTWANNVFEFGFAYHNFFWSGKEPGLCSDDALWLLQAIDRYINLTNDYSILNEKCFIAGTNEKKTRSIYNTIKAIIRYSAQISIGKHGLPLLDTADWNDCLKLDNDAIDGITKEQAYNTQIEQSHKKDVPFESNYSESVMNACLLQIAIKVSQSFAEERKDEVQAKAWKELSNQLKEKIQKHAWKRDYFARVLFNRFENGEFEYLGANNDGFSNDSTINGSYWLNSCSWAILADIATEEQMEIMLDRVDQHLKTPFGFKLITPTDLERVAFGTATGHYFPGDRENGAVFKHASMMFTDALLKAANQVENDTLAHRMSETAYWMMDLVLPYRTMDSPFNTAGNPRFCTQYNNSESGENIGPILSGTATWLNLSLIAAFGINFTAHGVRLSPILRENEHHLSYIINTGEATLKVKIEKPKGFYRVKTSHPKMTLDGKIVQDNLFPHFTDGKEHQVEFIFTK